MKHKKFILQGMQVLHDQRLCQNLAVVVEAGCIRAIIADEMIPHHLPAEVITFPADFILTPGFIDLHIHGADGHDVMDATPAALQHISAALVREGVTGYLATTMTAGVDDIMRALKNIAIAQKNDPQILGAHLEGPFLSPAKSGAQQARLLLEPKITQFDAWQRAAEDCIKIVTLAPELAHADEFIQYVTQQGVIASIGHSNCNYETCLAGIAAGASHATHLFNAMSPLAQREPGAVGALLLSPDVLVEVIADNMHLHPAILALTYRLKRAENIALVTDAMRAKCLGDGQYDLGQQTVNVKAGRATLADGRLAGSTLTMPTAIQNMMAATACSVAEAIQMASMNPATALGLADVKGSIDVRKHADLVLFDEHFTVQCTWVQGELRYAAASASSGR